MRVNGRKRPRMPKLTAEPNGVNAIGGNGGRSNLYFLNCSLSHFSFFFSFLDCLLGVETKSKIHLFNVCVVQMC